MEGSPPSLLQTGQPPSPVYFLLELKILLNKEAEACSTQESGRCGPQRKPRDGTLGPAEAVGGWASKAEMLGYRFHVEFTARGVPDLSANLFYVNLGASFSTPYSPAMRKAFRVHARTKTGEEDREGVSKCPGRARTPNLRRTLQKLALRVTVNPLPDIYLKEAKSETSVHKHMYCK